ncbi:MAG TPA: sulfatase-like hydrolase/transferase, partial [Polyangiales bacterium]
MQRHARDGRHRLALLLGFLVSFSVYKLWAIGLDRLGELLLSIVFDAAIWIGVFLLAEALAFKRSQLAERAGTLWFYPVMYLSGALVFAHTFFYDAAIERRLTALDVTLGGISAFFREALPLRGYVALALLLFGLHAIAWLASVLVVRPTLGQSLFFGVPVLLAAGFGSAFAPRTPSVLFDTGKELWDLATLARATPRPPAKPGPLLAGFDKSAVPEPPTPPRFDKVIVLVMETMTAERMASEGAALDEASFLKSESAHLHRYVRYFPNNQDSRTGMLNMLASRVIPYEAYSDEGLAGYEALARHPSLVDRFRAHGYRTAFAVAQETLEEVVGDLPWDERLHLSQEEIDRAKQALLCFAPDPYENACEDLALLPEVVDFVTAHERAFVYQEFIWGHAYEYNAASGKTNTAYYSNYVDALLAELRQRGVLDRTLIALTSDHGFRDKSMQHQLGALQIPLLFHAAGFAAEDNERLFSHVDFKDL